MARLVQVLLVAVLALVPLGRIRVDELELEHLAVRPEHAAGRPVAEPGTILHAPHVEPRRAGDIQPPLQLG